MSTCAYLSGMYLCRGTLKGMVHRIQNFDALAENELREDALAIAEAGLEAIDIEKVVRGKVQVKDGEMHIEDKTYALAGRKVYFVGVGKCAFAGARAVEKLFGDRLTGGIAFDVSTDEQSNVKLKTIKTYTGTHPLPSETNVQATKRIMEFLSGREESDLVIMLISGGGSSLLCLPTAPMTCEDESMLFSELTARGASIQDMNIVRKHISRARGGALAAAAYPAEVISLIVSDVPGDDFATIASGPTVLDSSTIADAQAVLAKYNFADVANPVRNLIPNGASIAFIETPKEQKYFERVANVLFLTNQDALGAMQGEAARRGYAAEIVDDRFAGEAREIGHTVAEKLHAAPANTALLYAGESTVTRGVNSGNGGRNQEMALAALEYLNHDELIMPFASDGRDNTDHAGAIADEATRAHALAHSLSIKEHLDAHRSYDFFTTVGDALTTGYTGSNVSDLVVALKK